MCCFLDSTEKVQGLLENKLEDIFFLCVKGAHGKDFVCIEKGINAAQKSNIGVVIFYIMKFRSNVRL